MHPGINIPLGLVDDANLAFARQIGATRIVVNMDIVKGLGGPVEEELRLDDLVALRARVEAAGLRLHAIENFPLAQWRDVLLAGPRREAAIETVKRTIRNVGRAGIPCYGYYFSIAGVWGRTVGPHARGGAEATAWYRETAPAPTPIPDGELWGFRIDPDVTGQTLAAVSLEEMWERLAYFLEHVVPVAEEAGVRLAAHPDDPPVAELRGTGRLITHPDHFERLLSIVPSRSNSLEFCQGTISEMRDSSVYDAVRRYAPADRIAYVHLRNVVGRVPDFHETFLDDGDVDILKTLRLYRDAGYTGVVVPDHVPGVTCAAPWHAGMAWALGWIRAALRSLGALDDSGELLTVPASVGGTGGNSAP